MRGDPFGHRGAYGINAKAVHDNEKLTGIEGIYLTSEMGNGVSGSGRVGNEETEQMLEMLYGSMEEITVERKAEEEIPINFTFSWGRETECRINCIECYLVTEGGRMYRVSADFAEIVYRCYVTGVLPGREADKVETHRWEVAQ